jgi:hypothetical protein
MGYVDSQTTGSNTLTSGNVFVGNVSNEKAAVSLSGDVTMDNAGLVTIGALKVDNGKLAADAVTTAKILDGTIDAADLGLTTQIEFEGETLDEFETTIAVTDPTADRTLTLPDADGTIALTTDLASDTYKFGGATSEASGTAGLVPAPAEEADNAKFLKGDGTWAEVIPTVTAGNVDLDAAVDIDADGVNETTVQDAITELIAALTAATAPVVNGPSPIVFTYGETKEVTVTGNLIRPNHTLSNTGDFQSVYKSGSWSDSSITFSVTAPYEVVTDAPQTLSGSTQTITFSTLSPQYDGSKAEVFIKRETKDVTFTGSNFHNQMKLENLPIGYTVTNPDDFGVVTNEGTTLTFNVQAPDAASESTGITLSDNSVSSTITFETMALEVGTPYDGGVIVWMDPLNSGHGYIMRNADEGQYKWGGYAIDSYLDCQSSGIINSTKLRASPLHADADELGGLLNSVNSDWWVPSRAEWTNIQLELAAIQQADSGTAEGFQALSGTYWTSSEVNDGGSYINQAQTNIIGLYAWKNNLLNVRLIKEF